MSGEASSSNSKHLVTSAWDNPASTDLGVAAGEPRRGVDPRDSLLFWWLKDARLEELPRCSFTSGVAGGAVLAGEGKSGKDSIFARTLSGICAGRVGSSVT